MSEGLARILSKQDFNPENFVAKLTFHGDQNELLDMKQKVQILNDETAQALKKNVYKNYTQFIETAREISILEGEMYQLSHMLTEQKGLMSSMMEMSLVSDKAVVEGPKEEEEQESPEEETRKNLAFLLEKVDGCSSVTEVPGRQLIHDGDLMELDTETFTSIQRVHAFLLNDSLMIATWIPNRRGNVRYRFQGLYELDSLAIVNVKDVGPVKNAFKMLMFPETRIYQADSTKAKRQWLDILEDTKKKKVAKDKQRKEAALRLVEQQAVAAEVATSPAAETSTSFTLEEEDIDYLSADWLLELPEDLDMCIAQRDFEGAVDLVERANAHLKDCPRTPSVKEFRARIDHRVKQLTEGLMSELQVSPERSLRGGPRAARRAVTQLIRLGKSAQACELFLKNRSAIIKYNIRQLKFEGATALYIRCLCGVFFTSLSETAREFMKAFPNHYGCFSAFVVWSKQELEAFVATFCRQVFESKSSLTTITECVQMSKNHCEELSAIGLDLGFSLAAMLDTPLRRVIEESRDQLVEGVKYRAGDDKWRPMNHLNKIDCDKFVNDMSEIGLGVIKSLVYDECFIGLTMNTTNFAKSVLLFSEDLLKLYAVDLEEFIADAITTVFSSQIAHFERSLKSPNYKQDHKFILKNGQFVLESLMSLIEVQYKQHGIPFPAQLQEVNNHYRKLKTLANT
ncbi:LOW QUALITY PROTEIN: exocyst complex component 8-like [Haliotis rubra]|uniref:LOW QUALITY PROTEIN: exocyst complex component 8-like n=1 Tax=Haliotis rubra TaxID=36100 RepID=UPI001EE50010|nr:LOW QUALITY PROTEIN: exocyst complex component 8-like [Haliotis rubra]